MPSYEEEDTCGVWTHMHQTKCIVYTIRPQKNIDRGEQQRQGENFSVVVCVCIT